MLTAIYPENMVWNDFSTNIFAAAAVQNWLKSMFTGEK
ncbi:MAG: hypothetical protein BWX55_00837 [Deltaproteobacteria bacterium ADurb.Bin022]|nr:MAG: hypothetical protein BWX55_00837 [Deltaproteobacteria bacterium ADurb.Bin022]